MAFSHPRTVRFADTDAAGVVFFARYLEICHEAYEAALEAAGIELKGFFSSQGVIVPIARTEARYLRPLHPGDRIRVSVAPARLSDSSYEVRFELVRDEPPHQRVAVARTEHVCIDAAARKRAPLPGPLSRWVAEGPGAETRRR